MVEAIFVWHIIVPIVLELYEVDLFALIYLLCVMSCRWQVISFSLSNFVEEQNQKQFYDKSYTLFTAFDCWNFIQVSV